MRKVLVLCFLLISSFQILAQNQIGTQNFLHVEGKILLNDKGEKVILRGIGLSGWCLENGSVLGVPAFNDPNKVRENIEDVLGTKKANEFYKGWITNYIRKIDVASMGVWGFNSVRLPIHPELYTLPTEKESVAGQHTWFDRSFAITDSIIQWCSENKQYVILDLQIPEENQTVLWTNEQNKHKIVALWKKLAERYANEPYLGAYSILTQTRTVEGNALTKSASTHSTPVKKELLSAITSAIRQVDTNHIIIINGNAWVDNFHELSHLIDHNTAIGFTKDCDYSDSTAIQKFVAIQEHYKVPLWLGEPLANSNAGFTHEIHLLESKGINWSWCALKKMSFDAPLEIRIDKEYQKVLDYWNGKGPKPAAQEASLALMQLTINLKWEKCMYHKDIIDAMFRQVRSAEARPFRGVSVNTDFTVNAVDYDLGRNGVAYYDNDIAVYYTSTDTEPIMWNVGKAYRNDGVDIKVAKANKSLYYYVTRFEKNEWLQYTLYVEEAGDYTVVLTVSSDNPKSHIEVVTNDKSVKRAVPQTAGEEDWQTIELKKVDLQAGTNTIVVKATSGSFNFKQMSFTRVDSKISLLHNYPMTVKKQ